MCCVPVSPVSPNNLRFGDSLLCNPLYFHIIARVFPQWICCEGNEDNGYIRAYSHWYYAKTRDQRPERLLTDAETCDGFFDFPDDKHLFVVSLLALD